MEQISPPSNHQSQQRVNEVDSNPNNWRAFLEKFNPIEKKQFLINMQTHISQMIQRQMRKTKEALKKLKESHSSP